MPSTYLPMVILLVIVAGFAVTIATVITDGLGPAATTGPSWTPTSAGSSRPRCRPVPPAGSRSSST